MLREWEGAQSLEAGSEDGTGVLMMDEEVGSPLRLSPRLSLINRHFSALKSSLHLLRAVSF